MSNLLDRLGKPIRVCKAAAGRIKSGIQVDLSESANGRLSPEDARKWRQEVREGVEYHNNLNREIIEHFIDSGVFDRLERRG